MMISINGKSEDIQVAVLSDLLNAKQIEPQMVAVEVNDVLIERNRLSSTSLKEGIASSSCFIWVVVDDRSSA